MSCSHQISVSLRYAIDMMMSKAPAKTRKKLKTAARDTNVSPGLANATTPAAMKTNARTACRSFHQPGAMKMAAISKRPAAIATKPKSSEIEYTEV
jgi:hypothetical protein